ncbi:MAG: DUF2934 domain-containing protein [Nitrospira sp. LK70]|nr:DUF2934 domain-containing protein [Nitrospira sp. LK70]
MRRTTKKTGNVTAKSSSEPGTDQRPIESPDGMWERISRKAYELWEQRGRREGSAIRDWLEAEEIVLGEIHEARG